MGFTDKFSDFAARLRRFIRSCSEGIQTKAADVGCHEQEFDSMAQELFALQFEANAVYREFCQAQGLTPTTVRHRSEIPSIPTSAFKESEFSCLPAQQRTNVFLSSGTTEQRPSRHFHNRESLAIYDASVGPWFAAHLFVQHGEEIPMLCLTPPATLAPHSPLVHMFETVRREFGAVGSIFLGNIGSDGAWILDLRAALDALSEAAASGQPIMMLGTAFSFVHLLDHLADQKLPIELPAGSRMLETGGYKGRSRSLPKAELHSLITRWLGIPPANIVCEYGMSELGSQAYDHSMAGSHRMSSELSGARHPPCATRQFCFPPWARAQIISPETGRQACEGETGLIRVFDLANVYSVMAIQTEDLGIRRAHGFELIGRAAVAEPRGCSLMSV